MKDKRLEPWIPSLRVIPPLKDMTIKEAKDSASIANSWIARVMDTVIDEDESKTKKV